MQKKVGMSLDQLFIQRGVTQGPLLPLSSSSVYVLWALIVSIQAASLEDLVSLKWRAYIWIPLISTHITTHYYVPILELLGETDHEH
ncbi:protein of unknown function [Shewanella benthica]|uniref:Uncharacterized protein n=1 Tax=Shewanella benthica TaxID=43661 RepID=A0A330M5V7_9GAMM|nr:protein of unknown function [Shewanella benthica]